MLGVWLSARAHALSVCLISTVAKAKRNPGAGEVAQAESTWSGLVPSTHVALHLHPVPSDLCRQCTQKEIVSKQDTAIETLTVGRQVRLSG